jgi:hypothetical protein
MGLLNAIRGKRWILKPHAISVGDHAARANLFQVRGGFAIPITLAVMFNDVNVTMKDLLAAVEQIASMTGLHPGRPKASVLKWQSQGNDLGGAVLVQRGCTVVKIE